MRKIKFQASFHLKGRIGWKIDDFLGEITKLINLNGYSTGDFSHTVYDPCEKNIDGYLDIFFIPPTLVLTPPTNIMLDPFVNLAKVHLMGTSGTMMVMAQYPPPAPPAPAILAWSGYNVIG